MLSKPNNLRFSIAIYVAAPIILMIYIQIKGRALQHFYLLFIFNFIKR